VEIGQIIEIPIAMYHVNKETKEPIAFTDCSHLSLHLNSDKQGVFTLFKEGKISLFSFSPSFVLD
jgi:nuclear pore complex protein Nup210